MYQDLGENEVDMVLSALEILKIYKIQSINTDYNIESIIDTSLVDKESIGYNQSYGETGDILFQEFIEKISNKIKIESYTPLKFPFIKNDDYPFLEEQNDALTDCYVLIIPIKSNNLDRILKRFHKNIDSVGIIEEYFNDVVFYGNSCINILIGMDCTPDVFLDAKLVELLYEYKRSGELLC